MTSFLTVLGRAGAFLLGLLTVLAALRSAVRTFVLPRAAQDPVTRAVFVGMRRLFRPFVRRARTYEARDRLMAFYAPVSLLTLPVAWLVLVWIGYGGMFWALGVQPPGEALRLSGSSVVTLGIASVEDMGTTLLMFSETAIGLILVALLIAYLPTMYAAFSRREAAVNMLDIRAGSPPSAVEMLARFQRLNRLEKLSELWVAWEVWFAELEETHTSLAALAFFRSPQPDRSWVTAAGTVLDTAALAVSTLDIPHDVQADICIRAGYLALRRVADYFGIPYDPSPRPDDPISIQRNEFDEVYDQLAAAGLPLRSDRDQAWRDFAGWRVNYDTVLLALALLVMAPYAPWSADRSPVSAREWFRG